MNPLKVAVVGATGLVGQQMWRLLSEAPFPVSQLSAYGSPRSRGKTLAWQGETVLVQVLGDSQVESVDLVLASAGATVSRTWSPRFAEAGAVVVDNSSAFRSDGACPLVVPEVNAHVLSAGSSIIANPNCSTIQMVRALSPLHRAWGLESITVATYQSASGAGRQATTELLESSRRFLEDVEDAAEVFPHPLGFNVIPHIGDFDEAGETAEEVKMRQESRRILELPDLAVSATCVRVPVTRGHSEAVWATFTEAADPAMARKLLTRAGVCVQDDPGANLYPLPRTASGSPEVFVGRIRRDASRKNSLAMWVVSDNLLKGAATNALQIAGWMAEHNLLPREV